MPNHYVAQEYTGYSLGAHWTLYDNKGEAVRRVLHDWHYEHGHDVNADLSRILYKAELWRMSDNKKTAFFFDGHLTGIGRFNPSGNKVMTGLEMGEIIIWNLDVRPSAHYKGHVTMPSGMAMSADDTIMVSTAADNLVIIRNLASGTVARLYLLHGNEFVVCTNKGAYDYSDDKRQLARLFSGGVDVTGRYPGARIKGLLDAVIQGRH